MYVDIEKHRLEIAYRVRRAISGDSVRQLTSTGCPSPKPMTHIPPISDKFLKFPLYPFFFAFWASPTSTVMHLHIMLNTYWMHLGKHCLRKP